MKLRKLFLSLLFTAIPFSLASCNIDRGYRTAWFYDFTGKQYVDSIRFTRKNAETGLLDRAPAAAPANSFWPDPSTYAEQVKGYTDFNIRAIVDYDIKYTAVFINHLTGEEVGRLEDVTPSEIQRYAYTDENLLKALDLIAQGNKDKLTGWDTNNITVDSKDPSIINIKSFCVTPRNKEVKRKEETNDLTDNVIKDVQSVIDNSLPYDWMKEISTVVFNYSNENKGYDISVVPEITLVSLEEADVCFYVSCTLKKFTVRYATYVGSDWNSSYVKESCIGTTYVTVETESIEKFVIENAPTYPDYTDGKLTKIKDWELQDFNLETWKNDPRDLTVKCLYKSDLSVYYATFYDKEGGSVLGKVGYTILYKPKEIIETAINNGIFAPVHKDQYGYEWEDNTQGWIEPSSVVSGGINIYPKDVYPYKTFNANFYQNKSDIGIESSRLGPTVKFTYIEVMEGKINPDESYVKDKAPTPKSIPGYEFTGEWKAKYDSDQNKFGSWDVDYYIIDKDSPSPYTPIDYNVTIYNQYGQEIESDITFTVDDLAEVGGKENIISEINKIFEENPLEQPEDAWYENVWPEITEKDIILSDLTINPILDQEKVFTATWYKNDGKSATAKEISFTKTSITDGSRIETYVEVTEKDIRAHEEGLEDIVKKDGYKFLRFDRVESGDFSPRDVHYVPVYQKLETAVTFERLIKSDITETVKYGDPYDFTSSNLYGDSTYFTHENWLLNGEVFNPTGTWSLEDSNIVLKESTLQDFESSIVLDDTRDVVKYNNNDLFDISYLKDKKDYTVSLTDEWYTTGSKSIKLVANKVTAVAFSTNFVDYLSNIDNVGGISYDIKTVKDSVETLDHWTWTVEELSEDQPFSAGYTVYIDNLRIWYTA